MKNINFTLNGIAQSIKVEPTKRLIDVLREECKCLSVKEGCGEGECGACSIILNDMLVNSCIIPVRMIEGSNILTLEGIRQTPKGQCIIEAFADAGAVQCGFCTPGLVMATYYILQCNKTPDEQEIRTKLAGNLCRCTGYDAIIKAVQLASERGKYLW